MSQQNTVSPSRTYVAVCNKTNFNGHYLRKFALPEDFVNSNGFPNTAETAHRYYISIDSFSCVSLCITWEDFQNVEDIVDVKKRLYSIANTPQSVKE